MIEFMEQKKAKFHLPGLFEFYEFYKAFLPLFYNNREYFYDWAEISSLYGAPDNCIWGGGRFGADDGNIKEVLALMQEYGISARLTFSNSLLKEEHLNDKRCNYLCELFENKDLLKNGIIIYSDIFFKNISCRSGYIRNNCFIFTDNHI